MVGRGDFEGEGGEVFFLLIYLGERSGEVIHTVAGWSQLRCAVSVPQPVLGGAPGP